MQKRIINLSSFIFVLMLATACTKMKEVNILDEGNFTDLSGALKDATDIKMGVAIDNTPMLNDPQYAALVKSEFDAVTFGYSMKHGAIVRDNGDFNFTNTDALVTASGNQEIFGHTLAWHSNQNATYLKNFAGVVVPSATELLTNPGFENGTTGWNVYNTNGATITFVTNNAANANTGNGYMHVVNPTSNSGGQWRVQVASNLIGVTAGKKYTVSYFVRAAQPGGSIRMSTQYGDGGGAQYQGDQTIGITWQQIAWEVTANSSQLRILFDMGLLANTYFIDNVSVKEQVVAPSGEQIAVKVDQALNSFITTMVNRYKSKVKEWDVVNEPLSPSGAYRTSNNSSDISDKNASDIFFWYDYLGRDYALKAFNYARAADPTATLYINEYGLEASPIKTDSLVALVNELKGKGAKIDGIGTQLHAYWNTSYALIDNMFQKLAATGLLVRISELDIRINPLAKQSFVLTPLLESYQAAMYEYIINSYLKHVPAAQRGGITIWGLTDNTSWFYKNGQDFPLLFNADYSKKKAYAAILQSLKNK